jgi:hypothetical protein
MRNLLWLHQHPRSELEARSPGSIGQSLHPTVEEETVAVKDDLRHAGGKGLLSDSSTDANRSSLVPGIIAPQPNLQSVGSDNRVSTHIIHQLSVNVRCGPEDRQARTIRGTTNPLPDVRLPALPTCLLGTCLAHAKIPETRRTTARTYRP